VKAKRFPASSKHTTEKRETAFDRLISEFMFVPVFIVALWLIAFACDCVCKYCYNDNETVYVCEPVTAQTSADAVLGVHNADSGGGVLEDGRLDINAASVEELQRLDGIGATKARNIVETRTMLGGFRSVDDLLNVDGIGEKILEGIREYAVIIKN